MTESCRPAGRCESEASSGRRGAMPGPTRARPCGSPLWTASRSWSSRQPHEHRLAPPAGGGDPGPGVVDRRAPLHVPGVVARARAAAWRLRSDRHDASGPRARGRARLGRGGHARCGPWWRLGRSRADGRGRTRRRRRARRRRCSVPRRDRRPGERRGGRSLDRPHAAEACGARRRRADARAVGALFPRRGRLRPAHVLLRPVRLGKDVRARHGPRAAPARDDAADRRPRPELGLRPPRPGAGRRGIQSRCALRGGCPRARGAAGRGGSRAAPRPFRGLRRRRAGGCAAARPDPRPG